MKGNAPGFVLALGLLLQACSGDDRPAWVHLARGFVPSTHLGAGATHALPSGYEVTLVPDLPAARDPGERAEEPGSVSGLWLETRIPGSALAYNPDLGVWWMRFPFEQMGLPPDGGPPQRLRAAERTFTYFPRREVVPGYVVLPGSFLATGGKLRIKLPESEELPESFTFSAYVGRGAERNGVWRLRGRRFSGVALPVWPGERAVVRPGAVPPRSRLRVATALEPISGASGGPVVFRVSLEGVPLFEHAEPDVREEAFRWHSVELPRGGIRRGAELTFEVDGPIAFTSFFSPTIGPAEVGDYGKRPWSGARPDIVLFQVDTFRADNVGAYGGQPGLTPNLDALAEESLRFQAWSTSTYTLPAHASMFLGVYPRQAGILGPMFAVSEELEPIAERLRRNGYRTGAVTDAVMVSQRYGLQRGFEHWDEHKDDLEGTFARARAFLEADDGRPVFLFVQTYRVHAPYEVSERTRRELGDSLGIEGDAEELNQRRLAPARNPELPRWTDAELDEFGRRFRALYLGGVADFDRALGPFLRELEEGVLAAGTLILTSDHGEAFHEHGELFHSGRVYEEQVRVPLFLRSPGVEPGWARAPASLVDLAPTLAEIAGVPPDEAWAGRSLLSLRDAGATERPVFAFECWGTPDESTVAVIEGGRKVITNESPEAIGKGTGMEAFDLREDPGEQEDRHAAGEAWPSELLRRHGPRMIRLLDPLGAVEGAELDADKLRELEAMGYAGLGEAEGN